MKLYWANDQNNFGDLLAPILAERFLEPAVWANTQEAEAVVVGSVLDRFQPGWSGTVLGAGARFDRPLPLEHARVLAIRGTLTRGRAGVSEVVLGDPGLLVPFLIEQPEKQWDVGVVPHWSDQHIVPRHPGAHVIHVINPDPLAVAREIASCEKIISSSLHGIITADAFGIPCQPELFIRSLKEGGDFKFRDYASAIGVPMRFNKMREVPRENVTRIQRELMEVFSDTT